MHILFLSFCLLAGVSAHSRDSRDDVHHAEAHKFHLKDTGLQKRDLFLQVDQETVNLDHEKTDPSAVARSKRGDNIVVKAGAALGRIIPTRVKRGYIDFGREKREYHHASKVGEAVKAGEMIEKMEEQHRVKRGYGYGYPTITEDRQKRSGMMEKAVKAGEMLRKQEESQGRQG